MSIHINAKPGEIAKTVLLAGDPLRSKFIAENFLSEPRLVNQTRNAFFYTGHYNGKQITVGASGMGCPSIGIYSFELFTEFEVDTIIRIGTCGAYTTDLKLFDLINTVGAASESTYARFAWEMEEDIMPHQGEAFEKLNAAGAKLQIPLVKSNIHSSDIFYRKSTQIPEIAQKYNCTAVEMEAFALFANARYLQKSAACLLTVSDVIPTHEKMSPDDRERSLKSMVLTALEAAGL